VVIVITKLMMMMKMWMPCIHHITNINNKGAGFYHEDQVMKFHYSFPWRRQPWQHHHHRKSKPIHTILISYELYKINPISTLCIYFNPYILLATWVGRNSARTIDPILLLRVCILTILVNNTGYKKKHSVFIHSYSRLLHILH
jgi:hypothetical protein